MATTTANPQPSDPIIQKLVLRVTIDCEGCRKRVHKILTKLHGVQEVDINLKQQKVTVFGDVDVDFLLKKLRKSGRQVDLLPELKPPLPETVNASRQPVIKVTRDKGKQPMQDHNTNKDENTPSGCIKVDDDKPAVKIQQPPQDPATNVQTTGGGGENTAAGSSVSLGAKSDVVFAPEQVVQETSKESDKKEPENDESKKPDGGEPALAELKKQADGEISAAGKGDSGNIVRKKKKGGQNSNKAKGLSSSLSDAATDNGGVVLPNYSPPSNHVLPRDPRYYGYPPDLYTSQPVYAASYNTSHASNSTTTSYYAQQPADSYVYAYSGPSMEPTPYDLNAYNRQPLDSLEMFSDENPNGCTIM